VRVLDVAEIVALGLPATASRAGEG
jgi:hypothetical protein